MRQTVTTISTKLLRNTLRLEFRAAQAKINRTRVFHLDSRRDGLLFRNSLEELALLTRSTTNRLLAVYDRQAFQRRLELTEQSFGLQKNANFSYLLKYSRSLTQSKRAG